MLGAGAVEPIANNEKGADPEQEAVLADAVGLELKDDFLVFCHYCSVCDLHYAGIEER